METISVTKTKQVEYSPANYEFLKSYASKTNLNGMLLKHSNDKKMVDLIEFEMLKMLSLSPNSLAMKMNECQQCLANNGALKSSEIHLLNNLMQAYANEDQKNGQSAVLAIIDATEKSELMQIIVDQIKDAGINLDTDVSAQGWFSNLLSGIGAIVGGIIGGIIGGPAGSIVGAGAGALLGKALGQRIIYPREEGFMAGPNGETCTPPFLGI